MQVHEGDAMSADGAAWASIADAVARALNTPGLSRDGRRLLHEAHLSCLDAAGLPHPQSSISEAHPLAPPPVLHRVEAARAGLPKRPERA